MKIKKNKWNITKEYIIKEYVIKKRSLPDIAKAVGMPYETLFWYKRKYNIPSYPASMWLKGVSLSPKTEFKKGAAPWNKGTKGVMKAWNKGIKLSDECKRKVSVATKKAMARPEVVQKVRKTHFKKGTTPWNKNQTNVYSKETIINIRKARLRQKFPKKNTNAEIALFEILKELNISFKKHKPVKTICQSDAFVEPNIVLFADGDYWHCNPKFFLMPKSKAQIKNRTRDMRANSKLNKEGYQVIRLWEHDLLNNKGKCREIIQGLINR
ncbi:MAG: very short patch repair endonuclease [Nanoarchaeota archaeon]|nr:very short patch repair endonuclease [Nanoarchaeota archaeon]